MQKKEVYTHVKRQAAKEDEFEFVGGNKNRERLGAFRDLGSDSDSDDSPQLPRQLVMRLQGMTRSVIGKITTGGLQMLSEKHAKEMETEVSIQVINELFAHKTAQSMKGWRLVKDPIVQCLNITQKMQSSVNENSIYRKFEEGQYDTVTVIGLLFVPGSAVIALLKNDINTELRIPFTTLITNNWLGNAGTA